MFSNNFIHFEVCFQYLTVTSLSPWVVVFEEKLNIQKHLFLQGDIMPLLVTSASFMHKT